MKFIESIKSSVYNPEYYKEILSKPFSFSLRYFISLMALIALVTTIIFSVSTMPGMNKAIGEIGPNIMKYYPDDLEVTVKNGKVSTNVEEPFFIKMPVEFKGDFNELENRQAETSLDLAKIENLIVIDTGSPLTIDIFKNYKTFILISRENIAYYDNNAMKIQPLNQGFDGVVTKAKAVAMLSEVTPFIKIIPIALVPIVLFGSFVGSIFGYIIYLIFGAFVIWLAAKAAKRELEYGKSFQVGLHAMTLGIILESTVFWLYPRLEVAFFFTFLMVVIVWINLNFSSVSNNVPQASEETPTSVGKI